MQQKRCSKCGLTKAVSQFRKNVRSKDGLRSECKACTAVYDKKWREAHREQHAASDKQYREANREKRAAYNKRWRDANPESVAAYGKRWRDANAEKCAAQQHCRRARKVAATVEDFDIMEAWERDGYTCAYCGSTEDLTIDHIVPLSRGGAHSFDNLTVACGTCNNSKGAKKLIEWMWWKTRMTEVAVT